MKRISKALILWGIIAVLTACGQEEAPALAQNINIGAGSAANTDKDDGREEETAAPEQEASGEEGVFSFAYEGATLIPGEPVDLSALPECTNVAEVPSCAFGGNDKVYHFKAFELTTYFDKDEERIYSIYFIDPNLPTTEGLRLGDTVDDMKSFYGEDYETEGTSCIYSRGDALLIIITNKDIVTSIEYRLNK